MNVALVVEYVFEATFLPLDLETKQEDTESVTSTVTSDISSKNQQQSDSLLTKVKSKPIKTTASTSQSRLVYMRLQTECYTLSVTVQMKPVQQFRMVLFVVCAMLTLESVDEILWCYHSNVIS